MVVLFLLLGGLAGQRRKCSWSSNRYCKTGLTTYKDGFSNMTLNLNDFPAEDDAELASALECWISHYPTGEVMVIATHYTSVLVGFKPEGCPIGKGVFGVACEAITRPLIGLKLLYVLKVEHTGNVIDVDGLRQGATRAKLRELKGVLKALATGREGNVSPKTQRAVWDAANGFCQFEGCGENLSEHHITGDKRYLGYFAHIVAASKLGPRGHKTESARLADDPENIMLLCDKCHRLVDKIAPGIYDEVRLRKMRIANIELTNRLLEGLRYPATVPILIGNNITGQNAMFDKTRIRQALLSCKMQPATDERRFFNKAGSIEQTGNPNDWAVALREVPDEVRRLRALLSGAGELSGTAPSSVAVFGMTNMTTLILVGRMIGEGRTIQLFQFARDTGQWTWPNAPRQSEQAFSVETVRAPEAGVLGGEAVLLLHITAVAPITELPDDMQSAGVPNLPTLRITARHPGPGAISNLEELGKCAEAIQQAIYTLQDEWRVQRVHVFPIAPVSACLTFGQKLQARHHPFARVYEREGRGEGAPGQFKATLEIGTTEVEVLASSQRVSLQ